MSRSSRYYQSSVLRYFATAALFDAKTISAHVSTATEVKLIVRDKSERYLGKPVSIQSINSLKLNLRNLRSQGSYVCLDMAFICYMNMHLIAVLSLTSRDILEVAS